MLDLGETLVHDGGVLPHVPEGLEALSAMTTATLSGDSAPQLRFLRRCAVS